MAELDAITSATIKWLKKQVYKVPLSGAGTAKWRAWRGESSMLDVGANERVFDVVLARAPINLTRVGFGDGSARYEPIINIEIAYTDTPDRTVIAVQDFERIRYQVEHADKSSLQALGLGVLIFSDMEFRTGTTGEGNNLTTYAVIPVTAVMTVTH